MMIFVLAWSYVVLMVVLAEATSPTGNWLAATLMAIFLGLLPVSLLAWNAIRSARRAARLRQEAD